MKAKDCDLKAESVAFISKGVISIGKSEVVR